MTFEGNHRQLWLITLEKQNVKWYPVGWASSGESYIDKGIRQKILICVLLLQWLHHNDVKTSQPHVYEQLQSHRSHSTFPLLPLFMFTSASPRLKDPWPLPICQKSEFSVTQVAGISKGEAGPCRKVWGIWWEFCVYVHSNSDSGQEFILFGSRWHFIIFTQM